MLLKSALTLTFAAASLVRAAVIIPNVHKRNGGETSGKFVHVTGTLYLLNCINSM